MQTSAVCYCCTFWARDLREAPTNEPYDGGGLSVGAFFMPTWFELVTNRTVKRSKHLNLAVPVGHVRMGGQFIIDNKALNRSPFFPDAFGDNCDRHRDGFIEAPNTFVPFTNAITKNASIFFDMSMTSARDRRDSCTVDRKNRGFIFKPQFRPVRLYSFGSI